MGRHLNRVEMLQVECEKRRGLRSCPSDRGKEWEQSTTINL